MSAKASGPKHTAVLLPILFSGRVLSVPDALSGQSPCLTVWVVADFKCETSDSVPITGSSTCVCSALFLFISQGL